MVLYDTTFRGRPVCTDCTLYLTVSKWQELAQKYLLRSVLYQQKLRHIAPAVKKQEHFLLLPRCYRAQYAARQPNFARKVHWNSAFDSAYRLTSAMQVSDAILFSRINKSAYMASLLGNDLIQEGVWCGVVCEGSITLHDFRLLSRVLSQRMKCIHGSAYLKNKLMSMP